ncbi:glycoside hydrolase family 3 protein [Pendulispora albinea]|uniref:beta-N-acetylhexosaminidase n=1 Tax=Pendulispora albinea TaxID=2741071 RepID=A0ABZ2M0X3_9BACT
MGLALSVAGCTSDAEPVAEPPQGMSEQELNLWVSATMRRMSLEDKVSQLFVTYIYGQSADAVDPKNQEAFKEDTPAKVVEHYRPGGIIYFNNDVRDNIDNPKQIAAFSNGLQRAALRTGVRIPLFIATDQEQGLVTRIGPPATAFPGNMAVCASRNADDAKTAARITGNELRAMGVNVDFAPDADVNSNPANPVIGVRSFSSDPALTAQFVTAQVEGYQRSWNVLQTVSATAKHFPGHGDTSEDSHSTLPKIERTKEEWSRIEAVPFRAAAQAGIDAIMTAHIRVPKIDPSGEPSTLSRAIVTGLLRDDLGYKGLIITDSLEMEGVRKMHPDSEIPVLALEAGVDQLLMPKDLPGAIRSVLAAVQSGRLTEARIEQSVKRVLEAKFRRGIVIRPLVDEDDVLETVGAPDHLADAARITDRTVTVLRNEGNLLPFRAPPANVLVAGASTVAVPALAASLQSRGSRATSKPTGTTPSDAVIADAVSAANQSDAVIVLTSGMSTNAAQQKLVQSLVATNKPVVAVAVRNPYDAAYVDRAPAWLATYSSSTGSMESTAKVLLGEVAPVGKLPVSIPASNDPNTERYPLGHGLTW